MNIYKLQFAFSGHFVLKHGYTFIRLLVERFNIDVIYNNNTPHERRFKIFGTRPVCEPANMDKYVAIYNIYNILKLVNGT